MARIPGNHCGLGDYRSSPTEVLILRPWDIEVPHEPRTVRARLQIQRFRQCGVRCCVSPVECTKPKACELGGTDRQVLLGQGREDRGLFAGADVGAGGGDTRRARRRSRDRGGRHHRSRARRGAARRRRGRRTPIATTGAPARKRRDQRNWCNQAKSHPRIVTRPPPRSTSLSTSPAEPGQEFEIAAQIPSQPLDTVRT